MVPVVATGVDKKVQRSELYVFELVKKDCNKSAVAKCFASRKVEVTQFTSISLKILMRCTIA